jgi:hypothetical protein
MANFEQLKTNINSGVAEHDKHQTWDAYAYNSFAILAIIFTSLAAVLPTDDKDTWIVRVLAGVGAILISLEKFMHFGSRWVYNREMRHGYLIVAFKIYFYENLPEGFSDAEKKKIYMGIFQEYYRLKIKEGDVPGVQTEKKPKGVKKRQV